MAVNNPTPATRKLSDYLGCSPGVIESALGRQGALSVRKRLGEDTGHAVVANFGGTIRFDYTAYGDTINTRARLEGANKYLGTSICVSRETKSQYPDTVCRPVGRLVLKGKTEAIEVFGP